MPAKACELAADLQQLAYAVGRLDPSDPVLDDVAEEFRLFRHKEQMALTLHRVDHLLQTDVIGIERRLQERLRLAKEELRDGVRRLLEAGRRQGKR